MYFEVGLLEVYFKMADDFCASGHAQWVRARINTSNSYTLCWVAPTKYYLAACWYRSLQNFLKCVKTKVVKFECGRVVRSQMRANVVIRELILQECNILLPCIQLSPHRYDVDPPGKTRSSWSRHRSYTRNLPLGAGSWCQRQVKW